MDADALRGHLGHLRQCGEAVGRHVGHERELLPALPVARLLLGTAEGAQPVGGANRQGDEAAFHELASP